MICHVCTLFNAHLCSVHISSIYKQSGPLVLVENCLWDSPCAYMIWMVFWFISYNICKHIYTSSPYFVDYLLLISILEILSKWLFFWLNNGKNNKSNAFKVDTS